MSDILASLYLYRAVLVAAYDGDTVTVDIDLGCECWLRRQKMRLLGINTPEMRGDDKPRGILAREALLRMIAEAYEGFPRSSAAPESISLIIRTHQNTLGVEQREKYGRWLIEILDPRDGTTINARMVTECFAVAW